MDILKFTKRLLLGGLATDGKPSYETSQLMDIPLSPGKKYIITIPCTVNYITEGIPLDTPKLFIEYPIGDDLISVSAEPLSYDNGKKEFFVSITTNANLIPSWVKLDIKTENCGIASITNFGEVTIKRPKENSDIVSNKLFVNTDYQDYVYPTVKFTVSSATNFKTSDIVIKNTTPDNGTDIMTIQAPDDGWSVPSGTKIVIRSDMPLVYYRLAEKPQYLSSNVLEQKYIKLFPGDNTIVVNGKGITDAEILWNNRKYII